MSRLNEIKARLSATIQGPWDGEWIDLCVGPKDGQMVKVEVDDANSDFIFSAADDMAYLIDAVETQLNDKELLVWERDQWRDQARLKDKLLKEAEQKVNALAAPVPDADCINEALARLAYFDLGAMPSTCRKQLTVVIDYLKAIKESAKP